MECICSIPSFASLYFLYRPNSITKESPLAAALDMKVQMAKLSHGTGFVMVQKDRDSGMVYPDPHIERLPRIKYSASQRDREGLMAGQIAGARIVYAMGALEIDTMTSAVTKYTRSASASEEVNDEAFELGLKEVKRKAIGNSKNWENCPLESAHQMGTCRIGASTEKEVVYSKGKVWETNDVWVADASVFPSATGVNPMITAMGFAEWIVRRIVDGWKNAGKSQAMILDI